MVIFFRLAHVLIWSRQFLIQIVFPGDSWQGQVNKENITIACLKFLSGSSFPWQNKNIANTVPKWCIFTTYWPDYCMCFWSQGLWVFLCSFSSDTLASYSFWNMLDSFLNQHLCEVHHLCLGVFLCTLSVLSVPRLSLLYLHHFLRDALLTLKLFKLTAFHPPISYLAF